MMRYALTMPIKSELEIHYTPRVTNLEKCSRPRVGQLACSEGALPMDKTFVLKSLGVVLSVPDAVAGTYSALDSAIMMTRSELSFGSTAMNAVNTGDVARGPVARSIDRPDPCTGTSVLGELPPHMRTDTVVEHLINALSTIELDESESSLVYADAVRLALVTRLIGGLNESRSTAKPCPSKTPLPKWRLRKALEYIDAHLSRTITLKDLAAAAGLSRMHFAAQFRAATGLRPREFVLNRRIELAQTLLIETHNSLVDIALTVGFQTQAHFTTVFKRFVGDTPHHWRCAHTRSGPS